jgi:protein phosphatase 1 regulatory subunit 37
MNMNLRELYLADNKLNGLQDSAQLGNLLKFNCNIQILDLRNNHILDSGRDTAHCYHLTNLFTLFLV